MKIPKSLSALQCFMIVLFSFLPVNLVYAHTTIAGMSSFINGMLHPFVVTTHIISLIAVGLLIAQQGETHGEKLNTRLNQKMDKGAKTTPKAHFEITVRSFLLFFISIICGIFINVFFTLAFTSQLEILLLIFACVSSLMVIIQINLPSLLLYVGIVIIALLIGLDSTQESYSGKQQIFALLGSAVGAYVLLLYVVAFAGFIQKYKQAIGVRIIASWIVASIFMVIALNFKA